MLQFRASVNNGFYASVSSSPTDERAKLTTYKIEVTQQWPREGWTPDPGTGLTYTEHRVPAPPSFHSLYVTPLQMPWLESQSLCTISTSIDSTYLKNPSLTSGVATSYDVNSSLPLPTMMVLLETSPSYAYVFHSDEDIHFFEDSKLGCHSALFSLTRFPLMYRIYFIMVISCHNLA